jgi:ribosomal protein S6E (S10)
MPPPELPTKGKDKTQKLNVVDKSRMDWTGFVDKEGIAEELDTHGKTKEAYLGRMEFLAGVEARREEERKRVKVAAGTAGTT